MPSQLSEKQLDWPDDAAAEVPFAVHVTGPSERPRRSLKRNDTFLVLDAHGDIGASAGGPDGLFHCDTRYLSRFELMMDGASLLLLGSNLSDDNSLLTVDLTNPDIVQGGLQKDTVHIVRTIFLWRNTAYQRVGIRNHGPAPVTLELTLGFASDFADVFEVRGMVRKARGMLDTEVVGPAELVYMYRGLDDVIRRTRFRFGPQPTRLNKQEAMYRFKVPAGGMCSFFASVSCEATAESVAMPFISALLAAKKELRASTAGAGSVQTSNEIFNEMLCRAAADLNILTTKTPQGPYPYAGIPWYSTTFGRDGVITALQMLWLAPEIARGVLRRLAAYQATVDDRRADAQPGKILHEMRSGEMAALREVPFGLYYGTVDATPLFVLLAGLYFERTGDRETLVGLWPAIEAGLRWIDGPGDPDGDGFVEYLRSSVDGLANQGWKDSFDAIFHANGELAEGNIALVEVQAYVFAAKRLAARCARTLGLTDRARVLESDCERLADKFEAAFWCPEIDSYALALDGNKEPCRVRTSNAGQALFSGIIGHERACKVANGLLGASSFSGWGIRTVAKGMARFNPMSYHNGSVWPHDNALIALGFGRYGLKDAVLRVFGGLFDAASYLDLRRLPELFCGFQRQRQRGPTLYPVACAPQAWASVVPYSLLEAALGLECDIPRSTIRLRDPRLPPFLDEVIIRNLRIGSSMATLKISRRSDHEVTLDIIESCGTIQLAIVPPN